MKTDFSIKIGARIRHFRELARLTQLQLSEMIPCEPSTLAHYETGKNLVSMTRLKRISEVLNVEPYLFFIFDSEKAPDTLKELTSLLNKANKTQLGIIFNIVQGIIELK